MPLDIKLIYKAIVSKKYGIGIKADIMVNRTENPEKSPPFSGQLVFHKGCKNIQWGKDNLLNKQCWGNWTVTCKKMKLDHILKYIKE